MSERRQEFEHDLEAIEAKVIELFAMVAEDLPRATQALLTGNNEVLQVLLDREQVSNDLSPRARGIVDRMGNLASEMWRHSVDSWYQRDRSAASALEARDDEMDELHASLIAELASGRMALPVTMEMTLVARFYERLGDHAVNIARRVVYLAGTTKDSPAAD